MADAYVNEKPIHDNFDSFARGKVYLDSGGNQYSADVVIGITKTKKLVFYDIVNLVPASLEYKKPIITDESIRDISETDYRLSDNKLPQNKKPVNSHKKSSRKVDSEGRALTEQQAEYFKGSKAVDSEGNLQRVFHGRI